MLATHFVRTIKGTLVPTTRANPFGVSMKMLDKDFEAKSLEVPLAGIEDMHEVLASAKSSSNSQDTIGLAKFHREFGDIIDSENEKEAPLAYAAAAAQGQWGIVTTQSTGLMEYMAVGLSTISSSVRKRCSRQLLQG